MEESIKKKLDELESFERRFLDLGLEMFAPETQKLFPLDLLANAVMDRALSLIFGFTSQIRANNYVCAAPLVRIHLDSLLRFYAGFISPDPHDFAMKILAGERIDKMKDSNDKKMSDQYLSTQLSKEHPWIKEVYNQTSGFVHLSHKHISTSSQLKDKKSRTIEFSMSKEDRFIEPETKLEAIECMIEISKILYEYLYGWCQTKKQ
jgi:hypothetical protein